MHKKTTKLFIGLFLLVIQITLAQNRTIAGLVTDNSGQPLPGANVFIENKAQGVVTDFDGKFIIEVSDTDTLVISYVGYTAQKILVGDKYTIIVKLLEDTESLQEVVVVGYGAQVKEKIIQNVSIIKEEAIEEIPALSAQDLIQGQSSGVQVTSSSGVLGGAAVIRLRGVGSLSGGSQPLVVIDGVPLNDQDTTNANQYTLDQGGNTGINPLAFVNTNDIASFTILKDASATAVYGSRGANGVILITTKSGKFNSKTQVTLDAYTQVESSTDEIDILNVDQFRNFRNAIINTTNNTNNSPEDNRLGAIGDPGFDWADAVTRTGISKNVDLSVRGGSDKTSFFMGTNYSDREGFILGNDLQKIGTRLNLNHKPSNWLNTKLNLAYTNTQLNRVGVENNTSAPLTSAYLHAPTTLPTDENGVFVNTGFVQNVVAIAKQDINFTESDRFLGSLNTDIKLFKNLNYNFNVGIDRLLVEETLREFNVTTPGGEGTNRIVSDRKFLLSNSLSFHKTFGDSHNLNALGLISYEESQFSRTLVAGTGFASDNLRNVESAATKTSTSQIRNKWGLFSLLSKVDYDYQGKYLLEGTFRRDGSSRFGSNNRFGNFWAVAGGWIISKESFIENSDVISFLSLRASYGTSGNDRLGFFPSLGLFSSGPLGNNNGIPGAIPDQVANPDIKWEESKTLDIGFKSAFFDNRISFDVNYFIKRTDDLLLDQQIPFLTGFSDFPSNVGEIENKGFEFDLRTVNIKSKNFNWATSFNISFIENKVLSLPGSALDSEGRPFIEGSNSQRAIVGENVNTFYLIRYVGVNSETGDAEWLDKDGNVTTSPTAADRVIVGSALPDFYGGMTNTLTYKNFDMSFLINFSYGNDVFYDGLRFTDNPSNTFNKRVENLNVWSAPGDNAFTPAFESSTFRTVAQRSTRQLRDGSFLRMKNLSIGYTLEDKVLSSVSFLSKVRFYFTTTNLFTIKGDDLDGLDPEVTDDISPLVQGETFFSAPQSKSYLFGVRANF